MKLLTGGKIIHLLERKNNPPFGKEKISELQKALEEVQRDNTRSQEDILEVSWKLQNAY